MRNKDPKGDSPSSSSTEPGLSSPSTRSENLNLPNPTPLRRFILKIQNSFVSAIQKGRHRHLELLLLSTFGTIIGVLLIGRGAFNLGPLRTSLSLSPTLSGGTNVDLGPLGTIMLESHKGLIRVGVDILSLDTDAARSVVSDPASLELLATTAGNDLRSALILLAFKAAAGGALLAGLLALIAFRRWRSALSSVLISLLISTTAATSAFATFDDRAVLEPRFDGIVAAAPSLIGSAKDIAENFGKYRDQMGRLFTNVAKLYNLGTDLPSYEVDPNTVTVLHVSDIHLNPQGWDLIASLVKQFKVDIVADTGDVSDHGTALEDEFLNPITTLGVPYVYVRGNHDSMHTQEVISSFKNAVVLDNGDRATVAGIVFAGIGDPRFTPDKSIPVPATADVLASGAAFAKRLQEQPGVSVALLHDPAAAISLDGLVPTVLAGHLHKRSVKDLPNGTRLMTQGSTGGSGLRALTGRGADPLSATIVHLNKTTGKVVAWDEITVAGIGLASAQITRHLPSAIPYSCTPATVSSRPTPTPCPSPSPRS